MPLNKETKTGELKYSPLHSEITPPCSIHGPLWFAVNSHQITLFTTFSFIIILLFWEFFTPAFADGFPLASEWQQVSLSTLLSILADLNNLIIWMVSTRPLFSMSSSPCINSLVTTERANHYYYWINIFVSIQYEYRFALLFIINRQFHCFDIS